MMKTRTIALATMFALGAASPAVLAQAKAETEWLGAWTGDGAILYVDAASIRRNGPKLTARMREDYAALRKGEAGERRSFLYTIRVDCTKRVYDVGPAAFYAGQNGAGKRVSGLDKALGEFTPVPSEGRDGRAIKALCSGAKLEDLDVSLGNDATYHRFIRIDMLAKTKSGLRTAWLSLTPYENAGRKDKWQSACFEMTAKCDTGELIRPQAGMAFTQVGCSGAMEGDYYTPYPDADKKGVTEPWEKRLVARMCTGDPQTEEALQSREREAYLKAREKQKAK